MGLPFAIDALRPATNAGATLVVPKLVAFNTVPLLRFIVVDILPYDKRGFKLGTVGVRTDKLKLPPIVRFAILTTARRTGAGFEIIGRPILDAVEFERNVVNESTLAIAGSFLLRFAVRVAAFRIRAKRREYTNVFSELNILH